MDAVIPYLLKCIVLSGLFTCYYWLFLRNKKLHSFNRFYLLFSIIISLAAPLIHISWPEQYPPALLASDYISHTVNAAGMGNSLGLTWFWLFFSISVAVTGVLLTLFIANIAWILRIKRRHVNTRMEGFNLIETQVSQAPFSFLDNLFWNECITLNDDGQKIFDHELAHIKGRHTYDKLLSHFVTCIFWMNPFYWIIQRELNIVHEFIADARSIRDADTRSFARMLLASHNQGHYLNLAHYFFHSPVKRRLTMLTMGRPGFSYWRKLLIIPVMIPLVVAFTFHPDSVKAEPPIKVLSIKGKKDLQNKTINLQLKVVKRGQKPANIKLDKVPL
ncbi:MAG TPA: M56 family metallopeptidase [Flavipsychrobacter sp.]|nr:M56 family metallopeptidase [Flavipsychrobacter sp.]